MMQNGKQPLLNCPPANIVMVTKLSHCGARFVPVLAKQSVKKRIGRVSNLLLLLFVLQLFDLQRTIVMMRLGGGWDVDYDDELIRAIQSRPATSLIDQILWCS